MQNGLTKTICKFNATEADEIVYYFNFKSNNQSLYRNNIDGLVMYGKYTHYTYFASHKNCVTQDVK